MSAVGRAELAVAILQRVVDVLDFADQEHDHGTADIDTDVVRAAMVNSPDELDSFVLRQTVELMMRALRDMP
jgi:hypothetical protein